jgi:N-acetylglucosamine-6-phosphate deacetylase
MLYVKPSAILTPDRALEGSAVLVDGGRIVAVGPANEVRCPPEAERIDAEGLILAPGFIDLQINGAFGSDFTANPSSIWDVAAMLPRYGVTSFLPTIITSPLEKVAEAQEVICGGPPPAFRGAAPLGLHLEGPFLNEAKRGAHDASYLRLPDRAIAADWLPGRGVRMVTLAPELQGALSIVLELRARGIVVSAGHSTATLEEARAGIEAGIAYGTHLFNAMPPLGHREPGLAGALLTDAGVAVGVIADGVHVHPDMVKLIWLAKGWERVSLVTDAMAALGMPAGIYRLGEQDVTVDGERARLADGRLAGSVLSLDQAVRNLVDFTGCWMGDAVGTVTAVPASLLGMGGSRGRIAPGYGADLTLLTQELRVAATIVGGEVLFTNGECGFLGFALPLRGLP